MSRHTLLVCEDAGAAAALVPVAARLLEHGERLSFWLGPVAAPVFAALPGERVTSFRRADGVLAGTTAWGERIEARATLEARALGLPTLAMLDFWSSYEPRLSFPGLSGLDAAADRIAAVDERMRDDLLAIGARGVIVTGSPAFEATLANAPAWQPRGRRVLFLSQPLRSLYGESLGYTEDTVLQALAPIVDAANAELVIRPHPREDRTLLDHLAQRLPGSVQIAATEALLDAIASAHVVVGMTTIALVHASLLGAPVVSAQLDARAPDPLPPSIRCARDVEQLQRLVVAALQASPVAAPRAQEWRGATARVHAAYDDLFTLTDDTAAATALRRTRLP